MRSQLAAPPTPVALPTCRLTYPAGDRGWTWAVGGERRPRAGGESAQRREAAPPCAGATLPAARPILLFFCSLPLSSCRVPRYAARGDAKECVRGRARLCIAPLLSPPSPPSATGPRAENRAGRAPALPFFSFRRECRAFPAALPPLQGAARAARLPRRCPPPIGHLARDGVSARAFGKKAGLSPSTPPLSRTHTPPPSHAPSPLPSPPPPLPL